MPKCVDHRNKLGGFFFVFFRVMLGFLGEKKKKKPSRQTRKLLAYMYNCI